MCQVMHYTSCPSKLSSTELSLHIVCGIFAVYIVYNYLQFLTLHPIESKFAKLIIDPYAFDKFHLYPYLVPFSRASQLVHSEKLHHLKASEASEGQRVQMTQIYHVMFQLHLHQAAQWGHIVSTPTESIPRNRTNLVVHKCCRVQPQWELPWYLL